MPDGSEFQTAEAATSTESTTASEQVASSLQVVDAGGLLLHNLLCICCIARRTACDTAKTQQIEVSGIWALRGSYMHTQNCSVYISPS